MHQDDAIEILLVEDSDADAEMTMRALRKHNLGNNVVRVADGAEALDFLYARGSYAGRSNGRPRLVLLDIKMPRMNGIEVLRQVKSDDDLRTIPVVMLTSSAEDQDLSACYRFGVNSYLVKPVDFGEFAEVVAKTGLYWLALNRPPT